MSREEQLERLLREVRPTMPREVLELWCKDRDAALSQQAEPSKARHAPHCLLLDPEEPQCYCTCGLEPAPAQDEQQPVAWQLKLPDGWVTLEKDFPSWAEGGDGYEIQPLYAAMSAKED